MKKIGPTFFDELAAAGLTGLPLAWGSDGDITFSDAVTAEQRTAVIAVYNAHDPAAQIHPQADTDGFIQAVKDVFGGVVAASALGIMPLYFNAAAQAGHWADVTELVIDAQTKSVITQAQYDAIKSAAATFNIPVTL